jgi:glycosyltransferase involved in cell wall biosynthesis
MNSVNPPKVLILTQCFGVGGLEKTLVKLAVGLKQSGRFFPEVHAYDHDPQRNPWAETLDRAGVRWDAKIKAPGFSWEIVRDLKRRVSQEGVSIIHTHDLNALLYGALAKWTGGRFKLVHTQHTFLHLVDFKNKLFERIFPRAADELVCPSESLRATYAAHGFPVSTLIPNGIEFSTSDLNRQGRAAWLAQGPSGKENSEAFETLRSSADRRWVLVLGRVNPGKGQERFLEVWPRMSESFRRDARVLFVGPPNDPDYLAKLKAMASQLPDAENLLWLHATSRPTEWMAVSDVFVSLSDFEGMPLAPVEAALSGTPLVLSDIPGHRGLHVPATTLVDAKSGAAVEKAVLAARPASAQELEPARRSYRIETMVESYEKIFDQALAKR